MDLEKDHGQVDDWVDSAKKIYFKENFITYIEEIDDILNEHK